MKSWTTTLVLVLVAAVTACSTDSNAPLSNHDRPAAALRPDDLPPNSVRVPQELHFPSPEGNDVQLSAGSYLVETAGPDQIRLIPTGDASAILLAAVPISHDEQIVTPVARLIDDMDQSHHVVLLTPGGTGQTAAGSETGLESRDITRAGPSGRLKVQIPSVATQLPSAKTLEAPAPLNAMLFPPGGWIKASGGHIPQEAIPAGANRHGSVYVCRGSLAQYPGSIWVGSLHRNSNGCQTKNGLIANYEVLGPIWQYASNGMIPTGAKAFTADPSGQPLFTCRAAYGGGWIAGKLRSGSGGCLIAWNNQEINVKGYDVLLKGFATPSGGGSDQATSADTFARAMPLGKNSPDPTEYPCLGSYAGGTYPGRVSSSSQGCAMPVNGQQITVPRFSTLLSWWRFGTPDPRSLVAGKVANDPNPALYACRYVTRGTNETAVGFVSHNFGTCEFVYPDGQGTGREGQFEVLVDEYKEVTPNWDPAVK
jgi:hypothetical protein